MLACRASKAARIMPLLIRACLYVGYLTSSVTTVEPHRVKGNVHVTTKQRLGLCSLTSLSTIFQLYRGGQFFLVGETGIVLLDLQFYVYVLQIVVCPFGLFLLTIVLSVLLRLWLLIVPLVSSNSYLTPLCVNKHK